MTPRAARRCSSSGTERDLSRDHPDPLAEALPPLTLDRQRIVHSAAFRRLARKAQVFVAPDDDHFRTRMTHTLEVAHLARVLAERLELDSGLAEAVALAHDLGHPPFGHAGERALNECLRDHGGFEHNQHALRIVEELEHPYPQFRGLNLTRIVRECLAKHRTDYDRAGPHPLQDGCPPPLEGQIVDLADRIAYGLHDLQDGLYAGLIDPAGSPPATRRGELCELGLWKHARVGKVPAALASRAEIGPGSWRRNLRPAIDRILLALVDDAVDATRAAGMSGVRLSAAAERDLAELDRFLQGTLYRSGRVVAADARARQVLTELFEAYAADPRRLPARYASRAAESGVHRVVADYVAGMTDRYCLRCYRKLARP